MVRSRFGSTRVEIAQITSFQSRASTSSSVTITNLVYMNWRRYDHTPSITRLACPGYAFLMVTTATRYEQPSGGSQKSTTSGNCCLKSGRKTAFSASPSTEGSSGGRPVKVDR